MTKSNGAVVTNYFASATFNEAINVYADDKFVLVLDLDGLRCYTKKGVLRYTIPVTNASYFWVKNKQEIMIVSYQKISVYFYSTGTFLKSSGMADGSYGNNFVNDGNKLYDVDSRLITYEYKGGIIIASDITTSKYTSLIDSQKYLSCIINGNSLWFDYRDRTKIYVVNPSFDVLAIAGFLPASKNPTAEDLEMESGNPNVKIFHSLDNKTYVLNISLNKVEFYTLHSTTMD